MQELSINFSGSPTMYHTGSWVKELVHTTTVPEQSPKNTTSAVFGFQPRNSGRCPIFPNPRFRLRSQTLQHKVSTLQSVTDFHLFFG
ncbi:hypothetical protein JTE90_028507 [Oedothorax gibbosus]|uniref:Uncharacterized protein n=1 Tax=Oedothorax gibbosus TaxID=931172 RepID=A0AAV6VUC3_9ARAC|nr:hypothetical protein JTE90_028507 [Oedothorax gibbosus]